MRVSHRGSLLKGVAVQGVLYQSILNAKLTGIKKLSRKTCINNRDDCKLENTVKQSRFKHLRELHKEWTEAGVSASRVTTLRHLQEKSYRALLNQKHRQKHLTWAKEKKNWAAMSSAGVGPLCFLKYTVNTAIYQEILEHFLLPSADKLYGDADFIFQQDLPPAHTAKGTKSWFNDHGVTVLDWPANSPDLKPIENLV